MLRLGNGKSPVTRHCSMADSISGVQSRSGFSGLADLSSVGGISLYGQRILCLVQLRLDLRSVFSVFQRAYRRRLSIPLWEILVTADMSTFANIVLVTDSSCISVNISRYSPSFTSLTRLGMAAYGSEKMSHKSRR